MDARNELKGKRGLVRLLNATRYSLAGYKAAWQDEEAFRQICLLAVIGLPLACWLGRDWTESVLLAVPLVLCLLVELLNSAIENVVDRISLEWHPLAKKAKDMGSAAQFTAQLFLAAVWGGLFVRSSVGLMSSRCRTADEASMYRKEKIPGLQYPGIFYFVARRPTDRSLRQ